MTLTTHYPAPQGGYDRLRLIPQNTSTLPCNASQEGTLAFDSSSNSLKICSSSFTWDQVQGVWSQSGNNIFPTKTSSNPNLKVGIGTMTPDYKLTIDGDGIYAKGTLGSGIDYPLSLNSELVQMLWYSRKAAFRAGSVLISSSNTGNYSAVGGGKANVASNDYSAVSGGQGNTIPLAFSSSPLQNSVISGGENNSINYAHNSVIMGGMNNALYGTSTETIQNSVIGGGGGTGSCASGAPTPCSNRLISGSGSSGGTPFTFNVINSVIAGGSAHVISSINSAIGGGAWNYISVANSFIGGGYTNGVFSLNNNIVGSAVAGGQNNDINDCPNCFMGGGKDNLIFSNVVPISHLAISGGLNNQILGGNYSVILGGSFNRIIGSSQSSAILGGWSNTINSNYSTILGGSENSTAGDYTLVAGRNMILTANADRSFVFGYSSSPMPPVDTPNAFILYNNQVPIFVGINKLAPSVLGGGLPPIVFETSSTTAGAGAFIDTDGDICVKHAPPFCIGGPAPSDRRLKKDIFPLTGALDNLLKLQGVTFEWNELSEYPTDTNRHMGFIAQDVETVFPNWVSNTGNGYKSLHLDGIKAVLVESIQEINAHVTAGTSGLAEKVAAIDAGIEQMKRQNRQIQENKKKIEAQQKEIEKINSLLGRLK